MSALFAFDVPTLSAAGWVFFALAEIWILGSALVGVVLLLVTLGRLVLR